MANASPNCATVIPKSFMPLRHFLSVLTYRRLPARQNPSVANQDGNLTSVLIRIEA
jgi:hypothetical protein